MKIKSIYKILIFSIVLLISLSAVAAEESMDNTTSNDDVLTSDSHDDVLTLNSNDDILTSSEKTWYVGKNTTVGGSGTQEDPFNNIELALNHSSSNDTIYINPGVYDGPHNTNLKIDIDNLTIKAKPNSVLLNANINNTRVFEVTGNDVSISGLNFSNIYMEYGGVIKWDGNGGSLTDSTIKNSKSRVGSIRWEGSNAIINNITILNSTSENGILVISGTSSNITNSTIRDTKGYYGAVMFGGKFNIIDNCTFINNTAWMNGGGVYDWGANNTVSNSLFIANNGTRGGAILTYEQQPNRMNIINNTFINNIGGQAGAIVVRRAGANIDNCTFINNSAGSAGAVLILSEANITNSIFENNSASTVGGAVYITGHGSTIDNSVFINNSARDGGAIYWSGENGTVTNTVFINNTVNNGTGEAIGYINNVTLNNVTLVNNNIEQVIVNETTPTFEYVFKLTEGYSNVKLTDNYTAYCAEKSKWSSSPRTPLIPHNDLSLLKNSKTGESVAEYLKILIYKHLKTPNGIRNLQQKIWIFTDDYYKNSTDPVIKEVISDYNSGLRIPDQGFSEKINSTTVLRIDFRAYNITKQIQNMIGFKSSLENITYNMSVVKNTLTPAVILGNQTSFEIKVTNTGSYYLTNVSVIEDGYDGLIYNSFSDSSGKWIFSRTSDGKPMWTYNGTLYVGISYSFNVTFNTTKTGNFTNFVVVTSNETDNKTTNNTTKVYKPDMTVEKLSLNRTVYVGNQTVFTIVVRNTGDCDLGEVFVVEKAPEGLVYNSFKGTDWSYNNGKFTYGKVLKVNESVSFEIVFDAVSPGNWTNVVVAGSNETDNKTGNNTTKVYKPDMTVEKLSLNRTVYVGNQTVFTIVVRNTGDCDLGEVFIVEKAPEGLVYNSFKGTDWSYDGNKFMYGKTLKVGESASFDIVFDTISPGNWTNVVVAGSNVTDNKTGNNTTKVYKPDMTVEKLSLNRTVYVGNQTVFTIVVRNTGDCDLGEVFIVEKAPEGLVYNSFKGTDWSYDGNKFTYAKVLKVNESVSFEIVFDAVSPGNWTNVVVAGSNETDNKTGNNTTKVYKPDMTVEKLSLNRTVYVGNQTVFTIVVRNTGDCDLGEVFIVEKAPEGLVYNSFKGTDWSYDGNKFTYAKVLKVNESVSFEIVFDAVSPGNWTNVVVAGSNLTGNKTGNNTTKVYNPGLKVEKITLDPVVSVGEITSFEIVVRNTGDCKLGDVFVHEDSYEGLRFHSFRGDMWKQKGDTFYYQGVLNPGESVSFVILFTTLKPGNFTNIVTAGSNVTNNTTTENKTKVIENHTNNNTNGTNKTVNNETKEVNVHKVDTSRATGNPLLALLMVLLMISVTTIRKFKK